MNIRYLLCQFLGHDWGALDDRSTDAPEVEFGEIFDIPGVAIIQQCKRCKQLRSLVEGKGAIPEWRLGKCAYRGAYWDK